MHWASRNNDLLKDCILFLVIVVDLTMDGLTVGILKVENLTVDDLTVTCFTFCICVVKLKYCILSLICLSHSPICQPDFFCIWILIFVLKLENKSSTLFYL